MGLGDDTDDSGTKKRGMDNSDTLGRLIEKGSIRKES